MYRYATRVARPILRNVAARSYATDATPAAGKLLLNFALPHESILKNVEATQVNLSSTEGDMGILADHVPTVAQLKPGVIEIFSSSDKPRKVFASGGFAIINPDSTLNINAVEAFPVEDIDFDAARRAADDATRRTTSAPTEQERLAAKIELEVYEAILATASK
ncbi:ATP synthase F1, epsilon subunit [Spizellomyces punctatus DAOM BR117]|uniref:ATP synthase subunit delta, mitochondrial n=1 Tax=Spizellomyces punctatus (strain DAOM BR117) TaxID=645134 RepID=A0A0L0HV17_SPIPD|nr:ATP synthase F1, epsilon subunit [Spizellomyces punctatus DAOM BR117]KND04958.1 ATP synthase F1, epsilon subunit [Spizellomyces punctatus DAOM BR117]|eukprot:XP_016612997.1 ATP synthase F1, epsilon subunit [Spizellomyces punctatus DAOM BR117]